MAVDVVPEAVVVDVVGPVQPFAPHPREGLEHGDEIGLATVVVGNGLFKPNISTMVGKLYSVADPRRDSGFTIFYMGINLGAMISPVLTQLLADVYWGDLDSHGFAILDRLRLHAPHAVSVLMNVETLDAWGEFTVPEPTPARTAPSTRAVPIFPQPMTPNFMPRILTTGPAGALSRPRRRARSRSRRQPL